MAHTFTGLKLQGTLGKFGRTEITDIEGYVELPDGKVLSGSEWGNMLLWEGGLIKVEIQRKGKKSCHTGPIQQILLDEGELLSIGIDGYIRVWDFEAIDTADTTDDTGMFELEPMNEMKVGLDVTLRSITKSVDADNEPTIWYAQDSHGGIWRLDLSFSHTSTAPDKLFTFHAGLITGSCISPISQLVATTGIDKSVRVFDYIQEKQVCDERFPTGGTSLLWVSEIIDPKGGTIIIGFSDGVIRIMMISKLLEESKRKKIHHQCTLQLLQALKTHNAAVRTMAIDYRGEVLATGSLDGTVFFLNVGKTFEPIGFIRVAGPVTKVQWSPDKFDLTFLLVFSEGGIVQEIEWPEHAKFDTSHSYEIHSLKVRTYKFRSVKSKLMHQEELVRKAIEEEERKKKEEEEKRRMIERGIEPEPVVEQPEQPKLPEPEFVPYIPPEPCQILTGFHSLPGTFWLSMGGFDAGYLYECRFSAGYQENTPKAVEPMRAVSVVDSNDVPINVIVWSKNGQQALFGMQNGQIRIQNVVRAYDISEMGPYWYLNVHDNNYGGITGLLLSFDGSILISTGADANIFQFAVMGQEQIDRKIVENVAKIPSARKLAVGIVPDDIQYPNAYSIEEEKQKAEYDKRLKDVEEKKREVRRQIAKMRTTFKQFVEQNEGLPSHLQLHKDEFEMDRTIKDLLLHQQQEKIDLVRRELAWESEKHRIALEKLRKRFKDVVECDRIVVKAFKSSHEVESFRATKLTEDFYQLKAEFERRRTHLAQDEMTKDPKKEMLHGGTRLLDMLHEGGDDSDTGLGGTKATTIIKGGMGERIINALNKVEEKKKKRAERRAQWGDLYAKKPDDDYEDPADIVAIKEAKDHMGDYKLKTAMDYVVPDHLRMNVEKARGRLVILKDLIHEKKHEYNKRLLDLRDKKMQAIAKVKELIAALKQVQSKLPRDVVKPVPSIPEMQPEEMPEKKLEYTKDTLAAFKKQLLEKTEAAKTRNQDQGAGGFGGFGGGEKKPAPDAGRTATSTRKQSVTPSNKPTDELTKTVMEYPLTPLEKQLQQAEFIRLEFEQGTLLNRIQEILQNFDAELRLLRHDKFMLDITMKNADLRQVTLFEELVLLKEYEKREVVLAEKVTTKQQEKLDMQSKIVDITFKLEIRKKDIEKSQEKEKALNIQFQSILGENNKFTDFLTKVFKKKIKRSKKTTEGENEDNDSDEESDDDLEWDEDEDEEGSEIGGFDLDICPPGCDQILYDATIQLREKRLDIEEALVEEKKTNEGLKKELESYQKKSKVIDNGLKTAQQDIEAFQLEKQQKLNELDVVVSLKLHQIQYMINGVLPQDLSPTLVFESQGVSQLQLRLKELELEKQSQKKYMKESKKKHVQLIKDRRMFDAKIAEMEDECKKMMVSKFGCVVDIEKLETVTINRTIEELKEKLRLTEMQCLADRQWNEKMADKKNRITDLIQENTKHLKQLACLVNDKKCSEDALDLRQKSLGEEYSGPTKAVILEKKRLIKLVWLQAQEIDALKDEILLLSRKGGHILPPTHHILPKIPNMRTV